ncbi:MAG TPA: DsrE family protein [Hyphomicrobiaceae bacterium]|nr:DsrE family protein [Hyphomicrobiaceae bacterium]
MPGGACVPRRGLCARALTKRDVSAQVTVLLMADAVLAAKAHQKTPDGYYNVERMLKGVLGSHGLVLLCGTCLDARGLVEGELITGVRSTMDELAEATLSADKVLGF